MRSHLALVVIAACSLAACTRNLQPPARHACAGARAPGAPNGIGIIGMSLDQRATDAGGAELFVDRIVPDGPAATAGIRPGDRILAIEGTPTRGMSIADAARRLRGPIEASVALEIATGPRTRAVRITRVAPSDLWTGAAPAPPKTGDAERVRASDVAPAAQIAAPPCR